MRVPIRKGSPYANIKPDPNLTWEKFNQYKNQLERLIKVSRPKEAEEVKRLALMGDFSENAAYQLAKGRLRGINQRITDLENIIKQADIISFGGDSDQVNLGNLVTVKIDDQIKNYRLLGSAETNPSAGIISHNSPLGAALMRRRVGDVITVNINSKQKKYQIIKIN